MIHLKAYLAAFPQVSFPAELIEQWGKRTLWMKGAHCRTYVEKNLFLSIEGTCQLEPFIYHSPRISLICHADLLGSGTGEDFREAQERPALYLARRYERDGDCFARDLRGWFGIILYDREQNALKAWTDHFGIRRIFYRADGGNLGIASDLRLLNVLFPKFPEIDPQAILEYIQYSCIPAPRTIYKDTFRLEPGCWLTSCPVVLTRAYWDMTYGEIEGRSVKAWAAEAFDAIQSAVSRAAKTTDDSQKLGCFLSGGTDSSSVSGLVGTITKEPPKTFSIGFDDSRYSEIRYARIAARHFQADHREYFVKPQDILDLLPKTYDVYDEPFGNSSIVPAYYCARMAADNGITHMLAGDGGDELFGGNQRYADDWIFQQYFLLPKAVRLRFVEPAVIGLARVRAIKGADLARRYIRRANLPLPDRYFSYDFLSNVDWPELFSQDFIETVNGADALLIAKQHFRNAKASSELNRWLYLDLRITITDNDIRKVTAMAEMAGIVPRYPLLDPMLAQFSGTLPSDLKVRGTSLRYLFKKAMGSLLPPEILAKKKHGFGLPFSIWLDENRELKDFLFDTLGSTTARQRGYFRPGLLEWLWSRYKSESKVFYGDVLWVFLMLELWHAAASQNRQIGRSSSDQ